MSSSTTGGIDVFAAGKRRSRHSSKRSIRKRVHDTGYSSADLYTHVDPWSTLRPYQHGRELKLVPTTGLFHDTRASLLDYPYGWGNHFSPSLYTVNTSGISAAQNAANVALTTAANAPVTAVEAASLAGLA